VLDGGMIAAFSTARSGLLASVARLDAAASNIAHAGTTGPLPAPATQPVAGAEDGAARAYQPVEVVVRSIGTGEAPAGVAATYPPRLPATIRQYDPAAPFADADGFVAAPNVDLAEEAVDVLAALVSFRANLTLILAADEMAQSLLDIRA
jgi:flagellar basal-body rod protein FlgC